MYDKSQHVPKFPLVIFSVVSYQCGAIFRGMTSWLKVRPKGFEDMCYKKEGVMLNSDANNTSGVCFIIASHQKQIISIYP